MLSFVRLDNALRHCRPTLKVACLLMLSVTGDGQVRWYRSENTSQLASAPALVTSTIVALRYNRAKLYSPRLDLSQSADDATLAPDRALEFRKRSFKYAGRQIS